MRFQREEYTTALMDEMGPLLEDHNRENTQLDVPLDPDFEAYQRIHASGCLRIYTARLSNILVGYQVFIVSNHPHRRTSLEATQDSLYLDPEVRQGMAGVKFIKFCDAELEKENVRVIHHPIDAAHNFGRIFERMGYQLMDLTFSRKVA